MIYFKSDNIISPLGFNTYDTFVSMLNDKIGIKAIDDVRYYPEKFHASMIDEPRLEQEFEVIAKKYSNNNVYTKLEKMLIVSVVDALVKTDVDVQSSRTAIILSTTKGNIDLLAQDNNLFDPDRVLLWKLGDVIQDFFKNPNKVIVISNACISGVLAINTAAMYITAGMYDNIVVTGADVVSRFVVSGFMSFLSLSPMACKPFDKNRDGLSLGEAAGTIILGNKSNGNKQDIIFRGGATANDANHISGPSRTAEGSYVAIRAAMAEAKVTPNNIDHVSAHGTATPYNDEMESIALNRHNLLHAPVNSIKGYLGHTLGAAGVIETAILLEEMRQNTILRTAGFEESGVSQQINIVTRNSKKEINCCLKMASGFGGSNAAMIISKV